MMPYAEYATQGLSLEYAKWSTIYDDAFGFGHMATVVYPISV